MRNMANIVGQRYEPRTPVDKLTPSDNNPNKGNVAAIAQSIDANTFYGAIIAQEGTGRIIVGHHRLRAAQQSGLEHVPVLFVDVDDRTADRMMLADNRTAELASTDQELLNSLLTTIAEEDGTLLGTGYEDDLINSLMGIDPVEPREKDPNIETVYGVLVQCDSEEHQGQMLEKLVKEKLECRAVFI